MYTFGVTEQDIAGTAQRAAMLANAANQAADNALICAQSVMTSANLAAELAQIYARRHPNNQAAQDFAGRAAYVAGSAQSARDSAQRFVDAIAETIQACAAFDRIILIRERTR